MKPKINLLNFGFIVAVHILAAGAIFFFDWKAVAVAFALWWVTGSLGIGLGFHRLLSHRSFQAKPWMARLLALCGTLAAQGGPVAWVAGHRVHHAHSDRDLDPHNSLRGFWWSHIGWIIYRDPVLGSFDGYSKYARDLTRDWFILFLDRWYVPVQVLLGVLLLLWGGWNLVFWGIFVRLVFGWHCTWLVNSAAHMSGYQTYDSRDHSRNCWWVALLSFGEGWHNNHHAFPRSARHGMRWWELDVNYLTIRLLEFFGIALEVRSQEHLKPHLGRNSSPGNRELGLEVGR